MSALIATEDSIIKFTISDGSTGSGKLSDETATITGTHTGKATWTAVKDDYCTILGKKVITLVKDIKVNVTIPNFEHVTDATGSISPNTITTVTMSSKIPLAVGDSTTADGGKNTNPNSGATDLYACYCEISDAVQDKVSAT